MYKPDERRRFPRMRREERAVLREINKSDDDPVRGTHYCTTLDISPTGLQIRLKRELQAGEPVAVDIHLEGYGESFHLCGETKWCRQLPGEAAYLAGVEILDIDGGNATSWRRVFN